MFWRNAEPATRWLEITFLIAAAVGLAIFVTGAILEWSNGAIGSAILIALIVVLLIRDRKHPPRSSQ